MIFDNVCNTHERAGPEPPHRRTIVHPMKQPPRVPESFTGSMKKTTTDALVIRRDDIKEESRQRVRDLVRYFDSTVSSRAKMRKKAESPNLPHSEKMAKTSRSLRRPSSVISRTIKSIEAAFPTRSSGSRDRSTALSAGSSRSTSIALTPRASLRDDSCSMPVEKLPVAAEESTEGETEESIQEDASMHEFVIKQLVEQLQAVQADKARAAEENARLQRENESLREMLRISMTNYVDDELDEDVVDYIEEGGVVEHIEERDEEVF